MEIWLLMVQVTFIFIINYKLSAMTPNAQVYLTEINFFSFVDK